MNSNFEFKNYRRESRLFSSRAVIAGLAVVLALLGTLGRMVYLQVNQHEHFTTLAQDNRVKLIPLPPTRGLIYDRNDRLLALNRPAFNLEIVPEKAGDIQAVLKRLGRLVELKPTDIERFEKARRQHRRFESIPIKLDISNQEAALFAVNQHQFPGISIRARLTRTYPLGYALSHVVGYVGRISLEDLKRIDTSNYAGTTYIGKTGVERSYEETLHGLVGFQQVEVNALGKTVRVLKETPPQPGKSLRLHLDSRLQKVALEAFGDFNGAAVAIDPGTGGVLALVSKPGYDPNPFVEGISSKDYTALRSDPDKPLFNRALKGTYPPGSTVKPFMGLAGLELGTITRDSKKYCPGFFQLPSHDHKYRDWKRGGHGKMDVDQAITQSCDVFFYSLAHEIGIDKLKNYLRQFHFGEKTGVDLVGEQRGIRPSREWKRKRYKQVWFPGETVIMGIGQGYFQATPLQLAAATAAIANGGHYLEPRLVAELLDENSGTRSAVESVDHPIPMHNEQNWNKVREAMTHVVEGHRGTARRIRSEDYRIAGKTGTAQVFTVAQDAEYNEEEVAHHTRDHALFIAYAPVEYPRIAVAVIVENGGHGGSVAAPIAKRIMDAWLLGKYETDQPQAAGTAP
ncbi:MAG: penicillin-binding protein 2 [Gammaproteobacteria bacterium]|nr:MAG: penicillin-binding protein 2 [Gammaproteobacteria bacterium]RTZ76809.1 MAG: penicillin-binding protein 2 [Gammaproteobacteria bacterium]